MQWEFTLNQKDDSNYITTHRQHMINTPKNKINNSIKRRGNILSSFTKFNIS